MSRAAPLQTVDRALQILLSFDDTRRDWGVTELAEAMDINASTSQRLLASLAARGFLVSDPSTRRYSLGPAVWHMANLWERSGGLARLAEDALVSLAATTDRTAAFAIPDGFYVRCIAAVDGSRGPVTTHPLVGDLYPAHAGAVSRAYFAFVDPLVRRNMFAGRIFARYTELTEVDEAAVERLLDATFRQGWAYSEGEYGISTRGLSVPVLINSQPVGSMSLIEPKVFDLDDDIRDHLETLQAAADRFADVLSAGRTRTRRRSPARF